ncbi:MAG TPA: T9SS type A sorting domain-containing protein [Chitinophagales bacterium]|nr:T9SS type A sorting domain-containing protein [Chitinophagales bacterium]
MKKYHPYVCLMAALLFFARTANAQPMQPVQPTTGPGSDQPVYSSVTEFDYGTNANADGFWIFEPTGPTPDSANLVVFIHGWGETNLKFYGAFIDRIVRAGNIVICPRYQKTVDINYSTYTDSCARGLQRALDTLQLPGHVKPRLYNYFILGHSMGGVLTANITMKYQYYNLPKPLAAFSMQPGADVTGLVLPDYSGFPADVKYLIEIGSDDAIVDSTTGKLLFYQTTAVPTTHKNLVRQIADNHGTPAITATHYEPFSITSNNIYDDGESNVITLVSTLTPPDAVDFYCYWKLWDALVDCALHGNNCDVAFGDTYAQKYMGQWSDGTPLTPLYVLPQATETAIAPLADNKLVAVWPNPAPAGNFTVSITGINGNPVFELYDIRGRKVMEQKLTVANTVINTPLPGGMYFYQIANAAGIAAKGKLIVK